MAQKSDFGLFTMLSKLKNTNKSIRLKHPVCTWNLSIIILPFCFKFQSTKMNSCQACVNPDCSKRKVQKARGMKTALRNVTSEITSTETLEYSNVNSMKPEIRESVHLTVIGSSCPERNILAKWCLGHLNSLSQIWHYHFFITYFIPGYQT